nr:probable LRR receptor-like serine/threonine-protein kinase At2g16250 [Tanacetum cinerariifolium]
MSLFQPLRTAEPTRYAQLEDFRYKLSSPVERVALFNLRASLGIRARNWPRKTDPCTNWTGIECTNGRVTGVSLTGLKRTRVGHANPKFDIPSLRNCSLLVKFNSSGFRLPGSIPAWLGGSFSRLQVLDLSSSAVLGSIPESIGMLSRLENLVLKDNMLTGIIPDSLKGLRNLSVVDFSFNMLTGSLPSGFSDMGRLKILDLSSNSLSGPIPEEFGLLSSLERLNLSNNSLASGVPVQFRNLSQLVELDLSFNSLFGSFQLELEGLTRLRRLLVGNNDLNGNLTMNLPRSIVVFDVSKNNLTGNLPDLLAFSNASGVMFNFSNNMFYGNVKLSVLNVDSIDLSSNYLQGLDGQVGNTTLVSKNCFLRLPGQRSLADCQMFYALTGIPYDGGPIAPVQPPVSRKSSNRLKYVLAGVFGGLGVVVIIVVIIVLVKKLCNKRSVSQRSANVEPVQEDGTVKGENFTVDLLSLANTFTYEQMLQATSGFSDTNLLKHGHSGDIFSGKLDGISVVIKKIDMRSWSFLVRVRTHDSSTSLEDDGLQSLDWITRLKIAIGAAEALTYLHHECNPPLVHRDIQASSILLDDKYDVRLGSLSDVCAQGVDNNQNVISRLLRISSNSEPPPAGSAPPICAYDVYCFGKVLLELVTGKLGISNPVDTSSKEWLDQTLACINNYDKELVSKIVDESLVVDEDLMEEVWAVAIVAKSCLNPKPAKRPQMAHILKALENPFRVVREDDFSSGRLRNNSSRQSWSAALFGSWRQSFSGSRNSQTNKEGISGALQSGRDKSQGSGANDKIVSTEIFPEPVDTNNDVERQDETR